MFDLPDDSPRTPRRKRWLLRAALAVALIGVLLVVVQSTVAEALSVTNDAVAPEVPEGTHVLVSKWTTSYSAGDIVLFRQGDRNYLGRVVAVDADRQKVTIARNGEPDRILDTEGLVGRAVLNTR